jgi:hypothetical protein
MVKMTASTEVHGPQCLVCGARQASIRYQLTLARVMTCAATFAEGGFETSTM